MDKVTRPQSAASVLAMNPSVDRSRVVARSPPARKAWPGRVTAAAPQARAAAARAAPSREGMR